MEKVNYEEAREWFWVRTAVWFTVTLVVSTVAYFVYSDGLVAPLGLRALFSVLGALAATLLAVLAALISIQFPWMRLGRWYARLFNGLLCAGIAALGGVIVSGIILSIMKDNIDNYPSDKLISACYEMMAFGIGLAAFWGLMFGSWFAFRRDKYFVEQI